MRSANLSFVGQQGWESPDAICSVILTVISFKGTEYVYGPRFRWPCQYGSLLNVTIRRTVRQFLSFSSYHYQRDSFRWERVLSRSRAEREECSRRKGSLSFSATSPYRMRGFKRVSELLLTEYPRQHRLQVNIVSVHCGEGSEAQ